ncbi:MAG: polyphenol oxidase family protein [Acidobacteriota bacterium]|nr:polyphenol oxidase family protein [Acidobacteriota bacterium]
MWRIETSTIGHIAVPPRVPEGFALFCTTRDFPGRLSNEFAGQLTGAVRERFGIDATLTSCTQVHGATVTRATRETNWRECDSCDALWTSERNVALAIKIADCLPVTLIDPTHAVIANAHSGWRGAVQQITAGTIDAVTRDTAFDATTSFAYLGPSIRVCCFEVGEEVAQQFDGKYVDRTHEKPHVDLVSFTRDILHGRGFAAERISDSELCTRCEGSVFHSFRRDGTGGGRNLTLVAQ